MKKRVAFWAAGLLVWAALFAWFIWPTPWEYGVEQWESMFEYPEGKRHWVTVPVRTHRITGEKQNQGGPAGVWGHFVW